MYFFLKCFTLKGIEESYEYEHYNLKTKGVDFLKNSIDPLKPSGNYMHHLL
jgi:hypothetical protein